MSESKKPSVSVIIPVFNGEQFLENAISSILVQDHHPLEVIIVDDGSTDNTAKLAASCKKKCAIKYLRQKNKGPAAARNCGIKAASGDIIAFLDVDDLWPENKLRLQLEYMSEHPSVKIVSGYTQWMWYSGVLGGASIYKKAEKETVAFNLGSMIFKREIFDELGLFNESLRYGEDVEWILRAREKNVPIVVLDCTTLLYYKNPQSMTYRKDVIETDFLTGIKRSLDRRRTKKNSIAKSLPSFKYKKKI